MEAVHNQDVVSISQLKSSQKIRNPFGKSFVVRYGNKQSNGKYRYYEIPGDGKWYEVTNQGNLANHLIKHLTHWVRNQWYDKTKQAYLDSGQENKAKTLTVPADVENQIHFMITGSYKGEEDLDIIKLEEADLEGLNDAIKNVDRMAAGNGGSVDVTSMINNAMENATKQLSQNPDALRDNNPTSILNGSTNGSNIVEKPLEPNLAPPQAPASVPEIPVTPPVETPAPTPEPIPTEPQVEGFAELETVKAQHAG